jgi:hypothetical protein
LADDTRLQAVDVDENVGKLGHCRNRLDGGRDPQHL